MVLPYAIAAAVLGVFSHLFYFIRGEHHLQAPRLLLVALTAPLALFTFLTLRVNLTVIDATVLVTAIWWAYMGALWTSMAVYRVFFHRLRSFDGPLLWKISKPLGHVASTTKLDNYRIMERLHSQYGDFVRTGPMELSIIHPEVAEIVHGPRSKCSKTLFYDMNWPARTVQEQRDRSLHDRRRRTAWDPGFSMKSLRNYESRVVGYTHELINQLASFSGKPVDVSQWFMYYGETQTSSFPIHLTATGFDVMGDLAFAKSFDMLKKGQHHWAIKLMQESLKPVGTLAHAPWIINLLKAIPGAGNPIKDFEKYSAEAMDERRKMDPSEPDIMSHILEAEPLYSDPQMQRLLMAGDSKLVIIAGSATTSSPLAFAFYQLAKDPSEVAKLRAELKNVPMADGFSCQALQDLHHLNGVVMETLRLHPAVPSFLHRLTPPEGITIGGRYIPGDTQIYAPPWSVQRSPKAYDLPQDFIPERWYSRPELIKFQPAPFLTFGGTSAYSCVGKNLAIMELRTVIAQLVMRFDVRFAPGEDGRKLLQESEDVFTTNMAPLYLEFLERK